MTNSGSETGDLKIDKFSCVWTIKDFKTLPQKTGEYLDSPKFSAGINPNEEWSLTLYPRGDDAIVAESLSLFLNFIWREADRIVKYDFALLKANDQEYRPKSARTNIFNLKYSSWGYHDFISRDFVLNKANNILDKNGNLKIFCQVIEIIRPKDEIPKCTLIEDFGNLLKNGKFSDVCLIVAGEKFQAHKAILASRSVVFDGMFKHQLKETETNCVDIMDLEPEVVKEMLTFIYSGKAPNLNQMASDLLAAADKYGLEHLKAMCVADLTENVCIETVTQSLVLADLYRVNTLKTVTMDFINNHKQEVQKTQGWQNMKKNHLQLIAELYEVLDNNANKNENKL